MAQAIKEVDRIVRAGGNYALVLIGVAGLLATIGAQVASPGTLQEGELIAILTASSVVAVFGAGLQVIVERSVRKALADTGIAELQSLTKQAELTHRFYIEQLKYQKDATAADREATIKAGIHQMQAIRDSSSTWPSQS